ncbi:hypothetical protein L915_21712 [Phytophthora nicotianae]|uniref:Uncharacterized protein n=1 Tax=Phytophthora nicotianae TaxID=4792 RepID=W2N8Z5_PHYNI|nr:hypothetical protein L915_21712 [Phytophthora nicotianae]ETM44184.1 hypothetical protein L914_10559 [Phytophthora nicotianae]
MHILGYGISCRFPPPLARSIAAALGTHAPRCYYHAK